MLRVVSSPPRRMDSIAFPTSTPYMMMLAPAARSSVANLCFAGTSDSSVYDCAPKEICSPRRRSVSAISTLSFESSLSTLFCIHPNLYLPSSRTLAAAAPLFPCIVEHAARLVRNSHKNLARPRVPGRAAFLGGLRSTLDFLEASISKTSLHYLPAPPLFPPPHTCKDNPSPDS